MLFSKNEVLATTMFNDVPKRTRFFLAFPRNARRQTSWPRERRGRLAVAARTALHSRTRTTRRHRRLSAPRRSHHLHRTRAAICAPWRVPRGSDTRAASSSLPSFLCARWRSSSACSPWIRRQASRPRAVYSSTNRRRVSRTTRPAAVPDARCSSRLSSPSPGFSPLSLTSSPPGRPGSRARGASTSTTRPSAASRRAEADTPASPGAGKPPSRTRAKTRKTRSKREAVCDQKHERLLVIQKSRSIQSRLARARHPSASPRVECRPSRSKPTRDHVVTSKHRGDGFDDRLGALDRRSTRARASPEFQFREGHPAPRARSVSNRNRRLKPPTLP